jgi:hypothetical protein
VRERVLIPSSGLLGPGSSTSYDADYEGGGIVHDFNEPLLQHLRGRYSLVFDGGSSEHIFSFSQR